MPGGLDGRLQREQLRSMRMQNAEQAMNMGRPTGMIQDLGMLQDLQRPEMMMEMQRMQNAPDAMRVLGQFADPTELALDYLRKLGLEGEAQPLPQQNFGMAEDPQMEEFRRTLEEAMARKMQQEGGQ